MFFLQLLFLLFYDSNVCGGGYQRSPTGSSHTGQLAVLQCRCSGDGCGDGRERRDGQWPRRCHQHVTLRVNNSLVWRAKCICMLFFLQNFPKMCIFALFFRHIVCTLLLITSNFFHPRWCYRAIVDVTYTSPLRMALQFADLLYWKDVAEPVWDSYFGTSQSQKPCRSGRDRTVSAPPPFA